MSLKKIIKAILYLCIGVGSVYLVQDLLIAFAIGLPIVLAIKFIDMNNYQIGRASCRERV